MQSVPTHPQHDQRANWKLEVWNTWHLLSEFPTWFFRLTKTCQLTLIGPGEVKVDLAHDDLKLQKNLLITSYFLYPFLQKHLPDLFELLTWPQKMRFWHPFWRIFVIILATASPTEPPPSARFYYYYRSPEGGRSRAVVRSSVRRQSKIPISFRSRAM